MRVIVDGQAEFWKTIWMDDVSMQGAREKYALVNKTLKVKMVDQSRLPEELKVCVAENYQQTAEAIRTMVVRGAGAIGAAAGFAVAQAAQSPELDQKKYFEHVEKAMYEIKQTRPTAYDLFYAIDTIFREMQTAKNPYEAQFLAVQKAQELAAANDEACFQIGRKGFDLLQHYTKILTHCNAGWLAFVDWGSATSPLYYGKRRGKKFFVWVDVTDPKMQGSKLTAWELQHEGLEHKILTDNAGGLYMQRNLVDAVIVGCDRIARNGDVANKIGTYLKALAAKEHKIPFFVAAPTSTLDVRCESGEAIPIEQRSQEEVLQKTGYCERTRQMETVRIAPRESAAENPAFDVTPARYVTAIITEKGIISPVNRKTMQGFIEKHLPERLEKPMSRSVFRSCLQRLPWPFRSSR